MRGYNDGYTRAVVIVHGKSEYDIVRHIKSKLRVPIEIYRKIVVKPLALAMGI
jgi:hypothetical protein